MTLSHGIDPLDEGAHAERLAHLLFVLTLVRDVAYLQIYEEWEYRASTRRAGSK
jgi:hypothetical protein